MKNKSEIEERILILKNNLEYATFKKKEAVSWADKVSYDITIDSLDRMINELKWVIND